MSPIVCRKLLRWLTQHLLRPYLFISDAFLRGLFFHSFETLELYQFSRRLLRLFEARIGQEELVMCLCMSRVLFNHTLQAGDSFLVLTLLDGQPRVIVKHRHIVRLQSERVLERSFRILKAPLFDGDITETCERVNVVWILGDKLFEQGARPIKITCGTVRVALQIFYVFDAGIQCSRLVKVCGGSQPLTFPVIGVGASQIISDLLRIKLYRRAVLIDRAFPEAGAKIFAAQHVMISSVLRLTLKSMFELFDSIHRIVTRAGNQRETKMRLCRSRIEIGGFGQIPRGLVIAIQIVKCDAQIVEDFVSVRSQ